MNRTRTIAALAVAIAIPAVAVVAVAGAADDDRSVDTESSTTDVRVGRITAAYVAPDELVFEPVELHTGVAARAAAAADGAEAFDFYVRETGEAPRTVPVAGDVTVTVVDCSAACEEGSPSDYASLTLTADGTTLHRVTFEDGAAVAIDAVYLP